MKPREQSVIDFLDFFGTRGMALQIPITPCGKYLHLFQHRQEKVWSTMHRASDANVINSTQ